MGPSENFFNLVEHFEGCKLEAYKDIAGIWTIGYGTTHYPNGKEVEEGDSCTEDEAKSYLLYHIETIHLPETLNQGEFDAILDFVYNLGPGAFNSSTLKKDVIAGYHGDKIANDFCLWDKAHVDGQLVEVTGLLRRRKCEAYLFNNGENHPTFFE